MVFWLQKSIVTYVPISPDGTNIYVLSFSVSLVLFSFYLILDFFQNSQNIMWNLDRMNLVKTDPAAVQKQRNTQPSSSSNSCRKTRGANDNLLFNMSSELQHSSSRDATQMLINARSDLQRGDA